MKGSTAPSLRHARSDPIETCPRCDGRSVYYASRIPAGRCKRCGHSWPPKERKEKRSSQI